MNSWKSVVWDFESDGGSPALLAGDLKMSAKFFNAIAHIVNAIHVFRWQIARQTPSIIGKGNEHFACIATNVQFDLGCVGMTHDIRERLFEREKQLVPAA
jgi:hypothetical protein